MREEVTIQCEICGKLITGSQVNGWPLKFGDHDDCRRLSHYRRWIYETCKLMGKDTIEFMKESTDTTS